jgi:thiamine biosynthesis lipoprotein
MHIIDPRTGQSIQNNIISVTVYAKDAMTADAYDNALMVMGLNDALGFAANSKEIEAYFIYRTKQGGIADTATAGFYRIIKRNQQ